MLFFALNVKYFAPTMSNFRTHNNFNEIRQCPAPPPLIRRPWGRHRKIPFISNALGVKIFKEPLELKRYRKRLYRCVLFRFLRIRIHDLLLDRSLFNIQKNLQILTDPNGFLEPKNINIWTSTLIERAAFTPSFKFKKF